MGRGPAADPCGGVGAQPPTEKKSGVGGWAGAARTARSSGMGAWGAQPPNIRHAFALEAPPPAPEPRARVG